MRRASSSQSTIPAVASTLRPIIVKFGSAHRCTLSIWVANRCPARPSSSGEVALAIASIISG